MFDIISRVLYNTTRVIARCIMLLDVKRIVNTPGGRIPFEFSEDFSDVDFGGVCPAVRPVLVVGQVRNIAGKGCATAESLGAGRALAVGAFQLAAVVP